MARADIKLTTDMDSSKLQAGLARARAGIRNFASGAMGQIAMLAGAMGFGGLARSAIEFGSTQSDIAGQLNINTSSFQALSGAMKDAGGSQSQMQKSIANMSKAIVQGGEGITTYKRAFDRLGLSTEDFKGKSTTEQFNMIAKAVGNAENQQEAFTSVMEVFGTRNAPQLIEVMKRVNSEGFEAMSDKIEETYGIMDAETQAKLDAVADKIEQFKTKAVVVFGDLLVKSMPYIEMLGMGLKHLGTTFVGWFNVSKATLEGVARVAMAIFEPMIKQFQGFGQVVASFKDIANPKKMFEGMKKGAETYVEGVKDALDFKSTFGEVKDAVKDVSGVFVDEFNKISDSGAKTLNDITDKYNNIGKQIDTTKNKASELNDEMGDTPPVGGGDGGGTITTGGGSKGDKVTSGASGRFDEADTNQSGLVTDKERRAFEKKQREIESANRRLRSAEMSIESEFGDLSTAQADEDPRFGSLDKPFSRGGRLSKSFINAQSDLARLDPNSPLSQMGQISPLDQSKKGGGAGESEDGKSEELRKLLEEIKDLNESTDENITEIKDLMDKIDGALT
jgi:hypothetical protein